MLPIALTRYFADSRLEVESFTRRENTLAVRIEKEIGPETGIIAFRQVSFLSLPMAMPGETIRSRPVSEAGPEFWSLCRLDRDSFDANDVLFEIESQDGPVYFVVAKAVEYAVTLVADADRPEVIGPADDVYCWLEQESSIMLKAVTHFGDPVELVADEARAIAAALLILADRLAPLADRHGEPGSASTRDGGEIQ